MKEIILMLENVDGIDFGVALIEPNNFEEYLEEEISEGRPFEITDVIVSGPLLTDYCKNLEYSFEVDEDSEIVEGGIIAEVRTFNTNKEIIESDFFTKEQAEYVKNTIKSSVSEYYKTWATGYKSHEKELYEVEERGFGSMNAFLEFIPPFNKDNLFFVLADTLPLKETVIAEVGYKNPDGTISRADFEHDIYNYNGPIVKYDNEEY